MASLALIDNVIDLQEDTQSDVDDDFDNEDESETFYDMERIIADCVSSSDLNAVWDTMSCHSTYLSSYLRTHHILLHSHSAPLPAPMRHMIGIMAAARLSCSYLLQQHRTELHRLAARGGTEWLDRGLAGFPAKIRKLSELNMVLAHRPWQMTRDHVAELTKPGTDSWSLSELVYSIILMCHFHSLSSFVMSCVMMEPDVTVDMMNSNQIFSSEQESYKVEELMKKMSTLSRNQDCPPPQEVLQSSFNKIRKQTSDSDINELPYIETDITNYIEDVNFQYVDFAKRQDEFATFRIQDFSWDEEGYSTIARFDEATADCLDEKFRTIYNLTYDTMGSHTSIDTTLFRRATWNYIQCVWGIRHDDYDYHEVNELLHR